jgi:Lipase C-terminal domain
LTKTIGKIICKQTGLRASRSGDGSWGPFSANGTYHYEFAIQRWSDNIWIGPTHHFYFEPFERSDYFIRLNTNNPGSGLDALLDVGDHQTDLIITRYKELWGDQPGQNDALTIDGTDVVNAATCPIAQRVNALFAYDKGSDGVSDVTTPIASLAAIPFVTGVDLFIPATVPPSGTVTVALTPRDGGGQTQTLHLPNWPSLTDRVSIQFKDYLPPATTRHDPDRPAWWF